MLSVREAEQIIANLVSAPSYLGEPEIVNLDQVAGRILAEAVVGKLDIPHWDNSAMDGYAVSYEDVKDASQAKPVTLDCVTEVAAGATPQQPIQSGEAARIFTGSMMPLGADTIVIQENTLRNANEVTILEAPQPRQFVRHRGAFFQAGSTLLDSGVMVGAAELAVLATAQCSGIKVYRRPRVAILSTGNELVNPEQTLLPGQIVDSNQYALANFVAQNGGIPLKLGIVKDQPQALRQAIAQGIEQADVVLSTGGVSVGDYDYVEQILEELGGQLQIQRVAVKPGKPLTVASFKNHQCLYFGLPGNPVSALVSCWRFVQMALRRMAGQVDYAPSFAQATTIHNLKAAGRRETYLWGKASLVNGQYEFTLAGGSYSSGNLINLAQTNALAIVPVGEKLIRAGETVQILLID